MIGAMQLSPSQRRDLIILLVRVAWSDGVIAASEQTRLADALARLADGSVSRLELLQWLVSGAPEISGPLPSSARDLFTSEALRLLAADGDADTQEMRIVTELAATCFGD